ncbi:MAG: Gp138 family membrane-puncturing spike protein [Pseudomonadota bacterium]
MSGYIGKYTNQDRDYVTNYARGVVENQWGEMTGEVVDVDYGAQTATVRPDYKRRLNGKPEQIPDLQEVPLRMPRAGGFVVTNPVKAGDKVTLRPQMRNSEAFHGGGDYEAPDARTSSLSDYEAFLDGGEPLSKPIPNFNTQNMEIRSEDGQFAIEMSEGGKFRIRGAQGNVYQLIADALRLIGSDTLAIAYGSSLGNDHALENRAEILAIADKLDGMSLDKE